jgi:hypothetical protein
VSGAWGSGDRGAAGDGGVTHQWWFWLVLCWVAFNVVFVLWLEVGCRMREVEREELLDRLWADDDDLAESV